jgi:hypothetical protein
VDTSTGWDKNLYFFFALDLSKEEVTTAFLRDCVAKSMLLGLGLVLPWILLLELLTSDGKLYHSEFKLTGAWKAQLGGDMSSELWRWCLPFEPSVVLMLSCPGLLVVT